VGFGGCDRPPDNDGRITGQDAVQFFSRSGLHREQLARVWSLAENTKQGFLTKVTFGKAMKLISLAQAGKPITNESFDADGESIGMPLLSGIDKLVLQYQEKRRGQANAGFQPQAAQAQYPQHSEVNTDRSSEKKSKKHIGRVPGNVTTSIVDGLKRVYFEKVRPLEEMFKFGSFFSPLMAESDFEAKPMVLLLGQYSTGKTTFIKHLLGREYPGTHIGPEPTTDRFVVIMGGHDERRTPGNTIAVQPDKPFTGLTAFGTAFLSKFEAAQCPNELLEEVTLVDTPGVLSGEKQRIERQYDFINVCKWFASRCDVILLLFDPYKLDISDEFKEVIGTLKGHDDKVRVVLNKADQVDAQQLMRVYGALMWSLGKVFKTPEVCRVYIGSFNDKPMNFEKNKLGEFLFQHEQGDLMKDLLDIPARSCDRKINEFVKRVRAMRIHLLIIMHLKSEMPSLFGKEKAQEKLMQNITEEFTKVMREHHLPMGDFPDPNRFREILSAFDLSKFPKGDKKYVAQLDSVLSQDLPALLKKFDNPF